MTKNVENRNRVQPGVKSGGQFAPERHAEAAGVTLTTDPSPLDWTRPPQSGGAPKAIDY
ncbi:hypothetical protein ACFVTM_08955 [Arthrobacter sp. NPDC058130]|uniref:hypothetical protein n=1 Tax=Arthrobacter sp. NPDC058130 TaxID=3346353 RepID=UPI0036EB9377